MSETLRQRFFERNLDSEFFSEEFIKKVWEEDFKPLVEAWLLSKLEVAKHWKEVDKQDGIEEPNGCSLTAVGQLEELLGELRGEGEHKK